MEWGNRKVFILFFEMDSVISFKKSNLVRCINEQLYTPTKIRLIQIKGDRV